MILLPFNEIKCDQKKIDEINHIVKSTYRLITFCRRHFADDLLDTFLSNTTNLQELLSIKNAQMEAQNEEEAAIYTENLNTTLNFIIGELKRQVNFRSELQLFQLFRLTSPESHEQHPNKYRNNHVQIGNYFCPPPAEIPYLIAELFYNMKKITNPLIKCIYFHHELIRIHPFVDGNGRTTRIAKNWMLMYELYPPIFIRNEEEKKEYIYTLSRSFSNLNKNQGKWNPFVNDFFNQEIRRLKDNAKIVHDAVKNLGEQRQQV